MLSAFKRMFGEYLCSLKWNNMVHEGKVKAAAYDRPVGVEAGAA